MPEFQKKLFSTNVCTNKGMRVIYERDRVEYQIKETGEIVAEGIKYHTDICCLLFRAYSSEAHYGATSLQEIHETLGHVNKTTLKKMIKNKSIEGIDSIEEDRNMSCEACVLGKMHRLPCKTVNEEQNYKSGESIHADLCGPMDSSLCGAKYYMLVKDRYTNYRWVYFLKYKSDALKYFKAFCSKVETTSNNKVQLLRTDCGLKFINNDFQEFLAQKGIRSGTSSVYKPQQNGRIERENRTVQESVRSMLNASNVSKNLWAEEVNTAVYALNRIVPSASKDLQNCSITIEVHCNPRFRTLQIQYYHCELVSDALKEKSFVFDELIRFPINMF